MTRTRAAAVLSVLGLVAVAAALLAWRPWDPVPDELRAAVARIDDLPGVLAADVEYTVTAPDAKDGDTARALVTARFDAGLNPERAGETARRAAGELDDVEVPGVRSLDRSLWVNAGEPTSLNGTDIFPVMVAYDAGPSAAAGEPPGVIGVEEAFALWQAGAVDVRGVASASDGAHLVELAGFAAERGIATSLRTTDDRLAYEAMGTVPDVTAARLVADVGGLPGVQSVGFDAYAEPVLRVGLAVAHDSPRADDVLTRVEAADYARHAGRPVAVTLTDPDFEQRSGWVSALAPAVPEPHPVPLPAGVEPWPDDASAPACGGADLELSYGGSDTATGARYASVRARNAGARPCAVEGVPEIGFRNADGEAQRDVTLEPYGAGVVPARVVVPPGAEVFAPLEWRAMSTANDPDVTTTIRVVPVPRADAVSLDVLGHVSSPGGLDVLDGAEVRVGPWVQAAEGWS